MDHGFIDGPWVNESMILRFFLAPWPLNDSPWDKHRSLDSDNFVADVSTMPWAKGILQQVPFCDYLIQARIMFERTEGEHADLRDGTVLFSSN